MEYLSQSSPASRKGTHLLSAYMHSAFFLTGVGVLMLGPLLPLFSHEWHLPDSQVGMLLTAQFSGAFSGAILLQENLCKNLAIGSICLPVGYTGLALSAGSSTGLVFGLVSLLIGGFGIGQLINSISLISARQYQPRRGSALMSLNLTWSAGALLTPLLIGLARGRLSLQTLLLLFSATAVLMLLFQLSQTSALPHAIASGSSLAKTIDDPPRNDARPLLYFAALFFLYGALENSVTGWITTFAIRYAHTNVAVGAYSTTMLWIGISAGRTLALVLLRFLSERFLQLAGVIATIIATVLLHAVQSIGLLLLLAAVLGASLAPFIPVTSSLFLGEVQSTPRQAGLVMATAALGGAVLPLLIGVVSQHSGSLKFALTLPSAVGVLLFGLCIFSPPARLAPTSIRAGKLPSAR
jgi:FHS family glucose/mannose:H+ symporter-like MFS transporter